ncbi:hypothetical protein BFU36_07715 [Sulfolobus sp. A20]|uniref:hypothetical protein n=1 Tax=Saccharolobus sp. A20 TaxID=1891280 RepID=UPI000845F395|nr:hypothetical protein [Sulfolobus sp. A20]TRM76409.1 hypothetical protein DJ523_01170 [Sulfolobus sp. E5]TRM76506.1 hypothetical protein DJ532_07285 [Sulfolobus sp. A20-N-F8]TRM82196.1 hypothetical protein DJ524_01460 [Sulfolobus sp. D5]TRN02690.1 hypothetical protein DJ530_03780 [Sulfolobus sp. E1]AOL16603.1 hypothetical protein BFU36_07715 [Sulfolobus sp. A20]
MKDRLRSLFLILIVVLTLTLPLISNSTVIFPKTSGFYEYISVLDFSSQPILEILTSYKDTLNLTLLNLNDYSNFSLIIKGPFITSTKLESINISVTTIDNSYILVVVKNITYFNPYVLFYPVTLNNSNAYFKVNYQIYILNPNLVLEGEQNIENVSINSDISNSPIITGCYVVFMNYRIIRNISWTYIDGNITLRAAIPIVNVTISAKNILTGKKLNMTLDNITLFPRQIDMLYRNYTINYDLFQSNLLVLHYNNEIFLISLDYNQIRVEKYIVYIIDLSNSTHKVNYINFRGYLDNNIIYDQNGEPFLTFYNASNVSIYSLNGENIITLPSRQFEELESSYFSYILLPPLTLNSTQLSILNQLQKANVSLFSKFIILGYNISIENISFTQPTYVFLYHDKYLIILTPSLFSLKTSVSPIFASPILPATIYNPEVIITSRNNSYTTLNVSTVLFNSRNYPLVYVSNSTAYALINNGIFKIPSSIDISNGIQIINRSINYLYSDRNVYNFLYSPLIGYPISTISLYSQNSHVILTGDNNVINPYNLSQIFHIPKGYYVIGIWENEIILYNKGKFYTSTILPLSSLPENLNNTTFSHEDFPLYYYIIPITLLIITAIIIYKIKDRIS